jgi:hypothetical protein
MTVPTIKLTSVDDALEALRRTRRISPPGPDMATGPDRPAGRHTKQAIPDTLLMSRSASRVSAKSALSAWRQYRAEAHPP